ncbi:hypothetical protein ACFFRR_009725 [Megaselia abdita]
MEIPEGLQVTKDICCKFKKIFIRIETKSAINVSFLSIHKKSRGKSSILIAIRELFINMWEFVVCYFKFEKFEMSDCGHLKYFLGIKIDYNQSFGEMSISQEANIDKVRSL